MTTDISEVTGQRPRRRRYDAAFKRAIVDQTLAPGASVARIAREHGINANQLFKWRRQFLLAQRDTPSSPLSVQPSVSLVPVTVVGEPAVPPVAADGGQIEVRLPGGEVRICGAVDGATLQLVLSSLRR